MKAPKCEDCQPEILPGNSIAIEIYRRVGTSEGVEPSEIESAMRIYDLDSMDSNCKAELADKVFVISNRVLSQHRNERQQERDQLSNRKQ